jgi:hypothetical protein
VRGISNDITIKQRATSMDVKRKIDEAFERIAQVDADHVKVSVHDGKLTLTGTVRSWSERMEAEYAAWAALGVTSVKNELKVSRSHTRPSERSPYLKRCQPATALRRENEVRFGPVHSGPSRAARTARLCRFLTPP